MCRHADALSHGGRRYLTWDKKTFPHPERMQDDIASRGRKIVTIVDPHIKRDPNYPVFKTAEQKGYYVKTKDGADYDGCGCLLSYSQPVVETLAAHARGGAEGGSRIPYWQY